MAAIYFWNIAAAAATRGGKEKANRRAAAAAAYNVQKLAINKSQSLAPFFCTLISP